ncbi:hypothetical protein ACO1KX_13850, partial [Staphylococcus aureus]
HLEEHLHMPVAYDGIGANGAHAFRIGTDASRRLFLSADLVEEWEIATIIGLMVARRVLPRLLSSPGVSLYMDGWELRSAT